MNLLRFLRTATASASICLFMGSTAYSDTPLPLKGPGLGNLTYTQSELFKPVSTILWNATPTDVDPTERNKTKKVPDPKVGYPGNGIPLDRYLIKRRNDDGSVPFGVTNNATQMAYGINVGIMLNGYFVTAFAPDGGAASGGFLVYDVSDPRNIRQVKKVLDLEGTTSEFREPHSFGISEVNGKTYLAMQSTVGVEFWDFTDVNNIHRASRLVLPNIKGGDYNNASWQLWWQAPYLYLSGTDQGLFIVDATDPTNPKLAERPNGGRNPIPIAELGGIRTGPIFTMGNTMVISSMENTAGFSVFDISHPLNPILIERQSKLPFFYATCYNGKNLYTSGRGGNNQGNIVGFDLRDRTRAVLENSGVPSDEGLYCATQENSLFIGAQRKIIKFDVSDPSSYVQVGISDRVKDHPRTSDRMKTEPDLGQVALFGNLVFIGSDHGQDTAFMPHQLAPDTTPPQVLNISPTSGAVQQAVTSRIGIGLSDSILPESLNNSSFKVRVKSTGKLVEGRYSVQLGIINFSPNQPLSTNTEYEVVLEAGGIEDYAGNPLAERYVSTFTTAPTELHTASLRHHWPLTQDLRDVRGNQHGKTSSADVFSDGALDTRARKSGVELPSDLISDILSKTATVSYKIKTTMTSNTNNPWEAPGIFGRDEPNGLDDIFWGWIDPKGHLTFSVSNDNSLKSPSPVNDNKWHEVVMTRNAQTGEITLSVDGEIRTHIGPTGSRGITKRLKMLGEIQDTNNPFKGFIQDVKVYDGLLTPTQIQRLFVNEDISLANNIIGQPAVFDPAKLYLKGQSYTWNFGDGSDERTVSHASGAIQHNYENPGNYTVRLKITNADGSVENQAFRLTVTRPISSNQPIHSSNIIGNSTTVYASNPDSGTVAAIDKASNKKLWEIEVGKNPQTLALDSKGRIWVAVQGSDRLVRIEPTGQSSRTFSMGYGSAPNGIVITRNDIGVITLSGHSRVITFNPNTGVETSRLTLDRNADYRGIAVTGDNKYALVTRFRTNGEKAEIVKIDLNGISGINPTKTINLPVDRTTAATEASAPGVANYLHQVVIHPDGRTAYVPSKKDNIVDGRARRGIDLRHDTTVRSILSTIDLTTNEEIRDKQIDFNNRSAARAVTFFPLGNYAFVAQMESNSIEIVDTHANTVVGTLERSGNAPHGLYLDAASKKLYVNNFLSRDVAVYDISKALSGETLVVPAPIVISTVEKEPLSPELLAGKKIFYNAEDERMSMESYMSCASCHFEGDSDGTVWDFTQRGEGLRRTISLQGRKGTGGPDGKLHWTANFDEIQDFEKDIRLEFGGAGFMSDHDYQLTSDPLGPKKAGRSTELDNLAAYVTSLDTFNKSPHRDAHGCLSTMGRLGKRIYDAAKCADCHVGDALTDNKRHTVTRYKAQSTGTSASGELITIDIDTPTLHGVWESTSFLHDGKAPSLLDVFNQNQDNNSLPYSKFHGGAVAPSDVGTLVEYLKNLDGPNSCDKN